MVAPHSGPLLSETRASWANLPSRSAQASRALHALIGFFYGTSPYNGLTDGADGGVAVGGLVRHQKRAGRATGQ